MCNRIRKVYLLIVIMLLASVCVPVCAKAKKQAIIPVPEMTVTPAPTATPSPTPLPVSMIAPAVVQTIGNPGVADERGNYVKTERIGYIYTGDSRIRRLNLTINMKGMKDTWVVCKSGMGYAWFKKYGLPEIARLMREKTYIDRWVIISGWGVNDLWNTDTYIKKYTALTNKQWKKTDVFLLSVNPVDGRMIFKYKDIPLFNENLTEYVTESQLANKRISYVDTNIVMTTNGFSTIDGLHYSEKTNKLIYKTIRGILDDIYARINYQSMNININAERTLKMLNTDEKTVWSSSDENIFKIIADDGKKNENVTIKAVNPGSAYLIATVGERQFTCLINVVNRKVLVAYFSETGEVESMAEYLHKRVGGDFVRIDRTKLYPYSIEKMMAAAKKELEKNKRPSIDTILPDMTKYDVVYLGYPLWYGYAPRPVCTFLEKNDMTGKTIKPFAMRYPEKEETKKTAYKTKDNSVPELRLINSNAVVEDAVLFDYVYQAGKRVKTTLRESFPD